MDIDGENIFQNLNGLFCLCSAKRARYTKYMPHGSDSLKAKFLLTALPDVPFDGWTAALMDRTSAKLKISDDKLAVIFPEGVGDLVAYFFAWATEETLKKLKRENISAMRVRDRITLGVRTRLEILTPHKQAVAAALSFMALPPRSFQLPKMVWQTADRLWWAAGDTSTDYNHYTKRMLLSGVLTSTLLYWLNDKSKDHAQTWGFLDRRIENVLQIGQKIAQFKKRKENR